MKFFPWLSCSSLSYLSARTTLPLELILFVLVVIFALDQIEVANFGGQLVKLLVSPHEVLLRLVVVVLEVLVG